MYEEGLGILPYDQTLVCFDTDMTGGASGSPIHYLSAGGAYKGVAVYSHGSRFAAVGSRTAYARRLDNRFLDDVQRWRAPVGDDDRVCKLQLVIFTGLNGSVSDPLVCDIDGHDYDLTALWERGPERWFGSRNHAGDIDVYDLTPELYRVHLRGPRLRDLLGKRYTIRRAQDRSWFGAIDWHVRGVVFYVNDQLLGAQTHDLMIGPLDTVQGALNRGV
jgi:hypothetical protein